MLTGNQMGAGQTYPSAYSYNLAGSSTSERDCTMREIGGILGVNESRVSQIHKSALAKMHTALQESGIHSAAAF